MHWQSIRQPHQYELLDRHLRAFLGEIDASESETLREHLQWVEIAAGETLITQGEPGDSMYLSISGRRNQRRYRLPSLSAYLMNLTILYSTSRRGRAQQLTDLYFNPPMDRVGMLEWKKFDEIVGQGHVHGVEVLDKLPASELERFNAAAAPAQGCGREPQ